MAAVAAGVDYGIVFQNTARMNVEDYGRKAAWHIIGWGERTAMTPTD